MGTQLETALEENASLRVELTSVKAIVDELLQTMAAKRYGHDADGQIQVDSQPSDQLIKKELLRMCREAAQDDGQAVPRPLNDLSGDTTYAPTESAPALSTVAAPTTRLLPTPFTSPEQPHRAREMLRDTRVHRVLPSP